MYEETWNEESTGVVARVWKESMRWHEPAMREMQEGAKTGHWIWHVFPTHVQHAAGSRPDSAMRSLAEAREYLSHPELRRNYLEVSCETGYILACTHASASWRPALFLSLLARSLARARARRALSLSRSRSISNAHTSTHGTHECVQVLQAATEAMAHSARRNAEPAPYVVFDQRFRRRRDDAVDAFKVRASLTLFQAAAEANNDHEVLARCAQCVAHFNSDRLAYSGIVLVGRDEQMLEVLRREHSV